MFYDSIGSKIKHKKVEQLGKWIDKNAQLFITYFGFRPNKELFPLLFKINKKLVPAFFTSAVIVTLMGFPPVYSSIGLLLSMLIMPPLIPPKQFKKDLIKGFKDWGFHLLTATGFFFFIWLTQEPEEFNHLLAYISEPLVIAANQLGVDLPTYLILTAFVLILSLFTYCLYWVMSRTVLWIGILPLKGYARLCYQLNKEQPLKPFYLLSKTLILIVTYIIAH